MQMNLKGAYWCASLFSSHLSLFACIHFTLYTDLVSKDIVEKWIKYLRNEFPTVAFKASTQLQNKNLVRHIINNFCFISGLPLKL